MEIGAVIGAAPKKNVIREVRQRATLLFFSEEEQVVTVSAVQQVRQRRIMKKALLLAEVKCKRVILLLKEKFKDFSEMKKLLHL